MPALDGIRVLDLTRLLPGAYATQLLVDFGAEVVKIEDPRGGDTMRRIGARYFDAVNRGKKSVTLDLRSSQAASVLAALLATADVVVDSFRPSAAKRLGVDAAALRARHPRLVCVSMIGFPRRSARAELPAHDINYQSLAGLLARGSTSSPRAGATGSPGAGATSSPRAGATSSPRAGATGSPGAGATGSPGAEATGSPRAGVTGSPGAGVTGSPRAETQPQLPGPLVADIGAALKTAIAILAALVERQRTGVGSAIDVSLADAAREWALFPSTDEFASACYTIYETSDGRWLALGALEEKFWRAFCERLGRPEFIPLQHAHRFDEVRAVMRAKTCDEWLAIFDGVDTCLTPVVAPAEAPAPERPGAAPALGADTDATLAEAGLDSNARARLRTDGVI